VVKKQAAGVHGPDDRTAKLDDPVIISICPVVVVVDHYLCVWTTGIQFEGNRCRRPNGRRRLSGAEYVPTGPGACRQCTDKTLPCLAWIDDAWLPVEPDRPAGTSRYSVLTRENYLAVTPHLTHACIKHAYCIHTYRRTNLMAAFACTQKYQRGLST
jgi:hypothetical protein